MLPTSPTTADYLMDIIRSEMGLADDRVNLYNEKFNIPNDKYLFVGVAYKFSKPFSSKSTFGTYGTTGFNEFQGLNTQEHYSIMLFSRNHEALKRKEEAVMALGSIYARQRSDQYGFKVARIAPIQDMSYLEGAAILYRYDVDVVLHCRYEKIKTVPWFGTFSGDITLEDSTFGSVAFYPAPIIEPPVPPLPSFKLIGSLSNAGFVGAGWSFELGDYAYMTDRTSNTISILNISDPANPTLMKQMNSTDFPEINEPEGIWAKQVGANIYAYVCMYGGIADPQFVIYDVTDPLNPFLKGSISNGLFGNAQSLWIVGNIAFVLTLGFLLSVDITDPANPIWLHWTLTGVNSLDLQIKGNYAYTTDKNFNSIRVTDVTDPSNMFSVKVFDIGIKSLGLCIVGNYWYIVTSNSFGGGTGAIMTVDITDPANPSILSTVPCTIPALGNFEPWIMPPSSLTTTPPSSQPYLYVDSNFSGLVAVYSLANPALPVLVDYLKIPELSTPDDVKIVGDYIYVTINQDGKFTILSVKT
jgi:hypothetical protein